MATKRQILATLRAKQKVIAQQRDDLRELVSDIEEQFENAEEALSDLDVCIEKLSELL